MERNVIRNISIDLASPHKLVASTLENDSATDGFSTAKDVKIETIDVVRA